MKSLQEQIIETLQRKAVPFITASQPIRAVVGPDRTIPLDDLTQVAWKSPGADYCLSFSQDGEPLDIEITPYIGIPKYHIFLSRHYSVDMQKRRINLKPQWREEIKGITTSDAIERVRQMTPAAAYQVLETFLEVKLGVSFL